MENSKVFESLLPKLDVSTVLDSSCGMGRKTVILSELGYEVGGCDGSAVAIECARRFAEEEGSKINFLRSSWEKLGQNAPRKYDCVINDAFNYISSRETLLASAKGIYSVLNEGGKFVFFGAHQWSDASDRQMMIEEEWKRINPIQIEPVYEKNGIRLTQVCVHRKKSNGIITTSIFIIEEAGKLRAEIASTPYFVYNWTWREYLEVLKDAGFREIYSEKIPGLPEKVPHVPNTAIK